MRAQLGPARYFGMWLVAGMVVTMAAAVTTGKLVENVTAGDGLAVVRRRYSFPRTEALP